LGFNLKKVRLAFCTYLINVNIDTKDSETYEKRIEKVSPSNLETNLENMNLFLLIFEVKKKAFCN